MTEASSAGKPGAQTSSSAPVPPRRRSIPEAGPWDKPIDLEVFIQSIVDYAILGLDADGYVSSWNLGAERLKGYSREEILGEHFSIFYLPEDRAAGLPQRLLSQAIEQGHIEHSGWRVRKDGSRFWGDIALTAVRDAHGELIGFTKVTRDLTERKRAEEREHVLTLDLERANRLKSDFLANMSHEVRTPLNGILGMLAALLETKLDPQQRDYAETAESSSKSLLRIVNDILDFSKIEAGQLELERLAFSLRHAIRSIHDLFVPQCRNRGIDLSIQIPDEVPDLLVGDQGRLCQVLTNLVGNAVKFTSEGQVVITANAQIVLDGAVRLEIGVQDTGIGIKEEDRRRLFSAFTQADLSTTRRYGGTGLGLTISQQLIELMGGTIDVVSTPMVGSTFTISLELPLAGVTELIGNPVDVVPNPPRNIDGSLPRVLVAEDNLVNQRVVSMLAQQLGYEADIVGDGQAALNAVQSRTYGVVLMDCHMPGMDGFAATEAIRALPKPLGTIPIIAVTASALVEEEKRCLRVGMNGFLAKPITIGGLGRKLAEHIRVDVGLVSNEYRETLRESLGLNMNELIETYFRSSAELMVSAADALDNGDVTALHIAAHTLKGGSSALGIEGVTSAAATLERLAHEKAPIEVLTTQWQILQDQQARACEVLKDELQADSDA